MDGRSLPEMDKDRQRWPKFLTARCVMWAHITASGRPASAFLTRLGSTRALTRAGKEKAETMPAGKVEESRDRNRPLKVFVSERERAGIETRAAATGLSVSAYLRNLGLGFQPHSTLDHEAILALLKVNTDQGRLGGLSGQSTPSAETLVLIDIDECLSASGSSRLSLGGLPGCPANLRLKKRKRHYPFPGCKLRWGRRCEGAAGCVLRLTAGK